MAEHQFKVGDLVTRDGTDVHRVVEEGEGYGEIIVECLRAPQGGWCKEGDKDLNLAGRYTLIANPAPRTP